MVKSPSPVPSPATEAELLTRAESLSGGRLGDLAERLSVVTPPDLARNKGWVGELLERALGASSGSRAEPDFPRLGIELKTLPIDGLGRPLESTFVCTIALRAMAETEFEDSLLWKKLRRVLWIPVHAERAIPVAERRVAAPMLWSPTPEQQLQLRDDWAAAASLIAQGRTAELTGHAGVVLQVRPKAAKGSSRRRAFDGDGALCDEQPKGFYLRPSFTHGLLRSYFLL